jgi:hypothetical protein
LSEKVVYDEFAKKQDLKYGYIVDSRPTHSNYWGKVAEIDVSSIGVGDVNLDFLVTTNYYNKNQMGILRFAVRKASGVSIVSTNYVDLNWLIKSTTLSESKYVAVIQGLKVSLYARPANQYGGTRFELLQATRTSGEHISDYYTLYEVTNPTDTELPTNDGIVTSSVLGTTAPTPTTDNSTVPKSYVDSGLVLKAPLANPTFTGSVTVPTPVNDTDAATKGYVDSIITAYDKVIRTQDEFNALIGSSDWLGATSVALVGQFTLSTANNSGIKVPNTVKQIHGFNSAKITITNFAYDSGTAKGGLWYDTRPTTLDYSIRDLEVDCTGTTNSRGCGFINCTNLTNCTGIGTGTGVTGGYGFSYCTNLTNCTGTGTRTGTGTYGYGFTYCTNLTNCTGTGTGPYGCGFYDIDYASNCRDGGSEVNMWGGTNTNIDLHTCCKTPVEANNTTLNT